MALTLLMDDRKCFEEVRKMRWPDGVRCHKCCSIRVAKRGFDETQKDRQRYHCSDCEREFDDLTGTIFAGHHQTPRVWILCLYFMGLNLSNAQIGQELGLDADSANDMATQLRNGILAKEPEVVLSGEVECDEVYIVAGHKGHPEAVKKGREGRRRRLKGERGRRTLEKEKPPIFGMIQRSGEVVIRMLANVQQVTIEPIMRATIAIGTVVYTDEYDIYARVTQWGYEHHTVNHGNKENARDDDGDGFCKVHVSKMEGFWSLLRSWLRPHRGISQEKLTNYLAFFQFVHNTRKRGKALLQSLVERLLA